MRTDVSPGIALFASVQARSSQLPLVMAYEPIAMAAEHDATAPHRMYPWLGTVRRYGISRAMEVRSMRTQVTLQPGQKGTKQLLAPLASSSCVYAIATTPPVNGGSKPSSWSWRRRRGVRHTRQARVQ